MLNLFVESPLTNPPSEERIIPDTFVSKILFTNENLMQGVKEFIDRKIHFTGVKRLRLEGSSTRRRLTLQFEKGGGRESLLTTALYSIMGKDFAAR